MTRPANLSSSDSGTASRALRLDASCETVAAPETPAIIDVGSSRIGTTFRSDFIANIPNQGDDVQSLMEKTPGAYNEQLGLQRAEKVKKFLVASGIDPARILIASMGAEDAATGPSSWPADRRVQIELVP